NPEVRVAVDRRRAADLGVRMSVVGNALRLAVSGDDEISSYREGTEQYPVKMRVLESQRRDIDAIGKLTVPSPKGPVRIDNIARLERGLGPSALSRCGAWWRVCRAATCRRYWKRLFGPAGAPPAGAPAPGRAARRRGRRGVRPGPAAAPDDHRGDSRRPRAMRRSPLLNSRPFS